MRFILGKIKESNLRPHLPDTISKNDVECNRYKETNQSQLAYAQRHGHLRKIHGHSLPASSRTGHYAQTGAIRLVKLSLKGLQATGRIHYLTAMLWKFGVSRTGLDGHEFDVLMEKSNIAALNWLEKESKALIKQDKHVIQVAASTTPYFAAPVIFCHVISKSLAVE